jgi:hypothetical protein
VWSDGAWKYARCPRCYRQELTTWSEHYYHPPRLIVMLLRLGATPYRCAACRCNFASFKRCKERFSWRHQTHAEPAAAATERTSRPEPVKVVQTVSGKRAPAVPVEEDFDEPML